MEIEQKIEILMKFYFFFFMKLKNALKLNKNINSIHYNREKLSDKWPNPTKHNFLFVITKYDTTEFGCIDTFCKNIDVLPKVRDKCTTSFEI